MRSKKFLLLLLVFVISLFHGNVWSQSQMCDPPPLPPPGGDNPDDNASFANSMAEDFIFHSFNFGVLIFKSGYFKESARLIAKMKRGVYLFEGDEALGDLLTTIPVLVVPTGGLYGLENSSQFKAMIKSYVSNGGTLIVFAQQHGYEFSALPALDGKEITGYSWREDMSCQKCSMWIISPNLMKSLISQQNKFRFDRRDLI